MSKPIVVIWQNGVNLFQDNTFFRLPNFSGKNIPAEYVSRMRDLPKKRNHVCWGMTGRVMYGN